MTGRALIKLLLKKGWTLDRVRGSHHILTKGDRTLSVPVHSGRDLGVGLLQKLLKEVDRP